MSAAHVLSRFAGVGVLAAAVVTVPAAAAAPTVGAGAVCIDEKQISSARPGPGTTKEANTLKAADFRAMNRTLERRMERPVNQRQSAAAQAEPTVVDVVIHEVQKRNGTGAISDATWREQIAELNEDFAGGESTEAANTTFRFNLQDVQEHVNSKWFKASDRQKIELEMKRETRVGDYQTMNVWSVDTDFLGYAYYPTNDPDRLRYDGIIIHYGSVPGGFIANYNEGKTLTHEAGHWFGLAHTFEGGCTTENDEVADTPAQSSPTSGCPEGRDSCDLPGLDPIRNYMDYSYDSCYDQFTDGQSVRMDEMYAAFRA